jgi:hypothetical protein
MRFLVGLLSTIALAIATGAVILPLAYAFTYVGYIGCSIAAFVAVYAIIELIRLFTARQLLLRPRVSVAVLLLGVCTGAVYLHDELLPTRGQHSLDLRVIMKAGGYTIDTPSPTPSSSQ